MARTREARLVWRYGNDRRSDELEPAHATPHVVGAIHESFAKLTEGRPGRLVEKTPANSVRPWFVNQVFPDAVYVHIMRNGWSCVPAISSFWQSRSTGVDSKQVSKARRRLREARLSQLPHYPREVAGRVVGQRGRTRLYGPRVLGLQELVDEHGVVAGAALQWQRCVERSCAFGRELGADRYLEVRLEEFDRAALSRVLAFCGLAPSDQVDEEHAARYDPATARRQRPLPDDDVRRVAPFVVPVNAWLGYPAAPNSSA